VLPPFILMEFEMPKILQQLIPGPGKETRMAVTVNVKGSGSEKGLFVYGARLHDWNGERRM
jgi:hypothetical protein